MHGVAHRLEPLQLRAPLAHRRVVPVAPLEQLLERVALEAQLALPLALD